MGSWVTHVLSTSPGGRPAGGADGGKEGEPEGGAKEPSDDVAKDPEADGVGRPASPDGPPRTMRVSPKTTTPRTTAPRAPQVPPPDRLARIVHPPFPSRTLSGPWPF